MWMPLRSVKMKGRICGSQRRVWWPKWTPASSSCFKVLEPRSIASLLIFRPVQMAFACEGRGLAPGVLTQSTDWLWEYTRFRRHSTWSHAPPYPSGISQPAWKPARADPRWRPRGRPGRDLNVTRCLGRKLDHGVGRQEVVCDDPGRMPRALGPSRMARFPAGRCRWPARARQSPPRSRTGPVWPVGDMLDREYPLPVDPGPVTDRIFPVQSYRVATPFEPMQPTPAGDGR